MAGIFRVAAYLDVSDEANVLVPVKIHAARCLCCPSRERAFSQQSHVRTLFLMLLCAPYQSARLSDRDGTGYDRSGRSPSTS